MLLLINGYILAFLFLIMLILLSMQKNPKKRRIKIKEDIKKIKEQIEKE